MYNMLLRAGMLIGAVLMIASPQFVSAASFVDGDIISSTKHTSVYKIEDGMRRPFPTAGVYFTWFNNFSGVKKVSVDEVELIPLGKPMSAKENSVLIKFPLNPKIYAVTSYEHLQHIPDVDTAIAMFGKNWESKIIELPEVYSLFYTKGSVLPSKKGTVDTEKKTDTSTTTPAKDTSPVKKTIDGDKNLGDTLSNSDGSNYVIVDKCIQDEKGISVVLVQSTTLIPLKNGTRDAGYGVRTYTFSCVSRTMYLVKWKSGLEKETSSIDTKEDSSKDTKEDSSTDATDVEIQKEVKTNKKDEAISTYYYNTTRNCTTKDWGIEFQIPSNDTIYRFADAFIYESGELRKLVYMCESPTQYSLSRYEVDRDGYSTVPVSSCSIAYGGITIKKDALSKSIELKHGVDGNRKYTYACMSDTEYYASYVNVLN